MLRTEHLQFQVPTDGGDKEIIKDVSFTLKDGRFIAVTGPNGGGKSTIAKLIAGIERPTGGRVYLDGEDITELSVTDRARKGIGFAFQQPVRFKGIKVIDLMRIAAGNPKLTVAEACESLSEVGLCAREYVDREINASLSGGELKRIEIASVMVRSAKLTIFDEPEAGIDLWSFQNLIHIFQRMRERVNGTILVISHQERILNIADEIIVIDGGRVVTEGDGKTVLPTLMASGTAMSGCVKS